MTILTGSNKNKISGISKVIIALNMKIKVTEHKIIHFIIISTKSNDVKKYRNIKYETNNKQLLMNSLNRHVHLYAKH